MNREYIVWVVIVITLQFNFPAHAMQEGVSDSLVALRQLTHKNPKRLVRLCLEEIRKYWRTMPIKEICTLANLSQVGIDEINGDGVIEVLAEKCKEFEFLDQFKANPSCIDSFNMSLSVERKIAQYLLIRNKFVEKMIKNSPMPMACSIEQEANVGNRVSPNGMYALMPVTKFCPEKQQTYSFDGDMYRLNNVCKKIGIYIGIYNRITQTFCGKLNFFWNSIVENGDQLAWSRDSNYLAARLLGGQSGIYLFDIKNNTCLVMLNRHEQPISMQFSHHGLLLACAYDDRVIFYDVDASSPTIGKSVHNFLWKDTISHLCWSKDDTRLACVQNNAFTNAFILLWDYAYGSFEYERIKVGLGTVGALCWGCDDNYLAVGTSNDLFITIKVYDTRTLNCVKILKCPGRNIHSMDWIGNSLVVRRAFALVPKMKDYIWHMSSLYELHNMGLKPALMFELLHNDKITLEKQVDYAQLTAIANSLPPALQTALGAALSSWPARWFSAAYRNMSIFKKNINFTASSHF